MSSYRLSPEAKKDLLAIRAYTRNKWGHQQAQNTSMLWRKSVRS